MPFIDAYQSDGEYLFFLGIVLSDYAKTVLEFFEENSYVFKVDNPPNVPEYRQMEGS